MSRKRASRRLTLFAAVATTAVLISACGSSSTAGSTTSAAAASSAAGGSAAAGGDAGEPSISVPEGDRIAVTLITKDLINPFFIAMQDGAKAAAEQDNVELTLAAGKEDGDEEGQVQAIEQAIARGDQGILITPSGRP